MVNSITLFGVAVTGNSVPFAQINASAIKVGYLVHPDCCTEEVYNWLQQQQADFNSTFYQTWEDIVSKSREEILYDQLRHYFTAYKEGETWVPERREHKEIAYEEYRVILPITEEQLAFRVRRLLSSNIALSKETVNYCCTTMNFFKNHFQEQDCVKLIDELSNKEAKVILYTMWGLTPTDKFELLRYIAYKQLGSAMIVQSDDTFVQIKYAIKKFDFTTLNEQQIIALSSIFLRYKKFFLAFKNEKNSPIINKMRRLAKKYHTPIEPGFWETILSKRPPIEEIIKHANEVSIFKLLTIITACRAHLFRKDGERGFLIRNQKFYFKKDSSNVEYSYLILLHTELVAYIKKTLNVKVKLPKNCILTCPTSEKSFVGNYPFGSKFIFSKENAFVGVYWRNEWGTHDFDLSYEDIDRNRVGWNAAYAREDILFSGDMIDANPEATELLTFKKEVVDGTLKVNRYNGVANSRYDLILGEESFVELKPNPMVNNISLRIELHSEEREDCIGIIDKGNLYLMKVQLGGQKVSLSSLDLRPALVNKAKSYLKLSDIVTVVDDTYEDDDYIDLSKNLNKDTIINLLTQKGKNI